MRLDLELELGEPLGGHRHRLERWVASVGEDEVLDEVGHVVVPGTEQDPARAGWATIARLVGADADALPVTATATAPDAASLAVLRDVNASVDGRADRRTQRQLVEAHLVRSTDAPAAVPADLHEELTELAEAWGKALAEGGYAVTGDASDLLPAAAPVAVAAPELVLSARLVQTAGGAVRVRPLTNLLCIRAVPPNSDATKFRNLPLASSGVRH